MMIILNCIAKILIVKLWSGKCQVSETCSAVPVTNFNYLQDRSESKTEAIVFIILM